jgi:high-affinity K+ transport system ATPase subunit B
LKNRTRKKKNTILYAAIMIGVIIISSTIFFSYSDEQAKIRGEAFGNSLKFIQEDLRKITHLFDNKLSMFKEGSVDKEDFLEFGQKHQIEMSRIILQYDNLQIPKSFVSAVEMFKLSAETQLESDIQMVEWVRTGNEDAYIRSDSLLQQSFQYEIAALGEFKLAQGQSLDYVEQS